MAKKREIICEYQPYIDAPPIQPAALYQQSCSNDAATVNAWRDIWIKNARLNHERYGSFSANGIGSIWGTARNQPAIVVGSGPSLRENIDGLKANKGIPVVSCLHNFHLFVDRGIKCDYWVTLDSGPVTIEEVSEGGSQSEETYWAATKDQTLLAYIASDPGLLSKWQGKVLFFTCPVPDQEVLKEQAALEEFHTNVSTGGNVLGAATYIAKAIMGANPIVFMGADFSFSYTDKFHGWDSKYDANLGHYLRATDVYGNSVKTWQSYANFKGWFDWLAQAVPGTYINCTEGGTMGAYPTGNIRAIQQMDLADLLRMYSLCDEVYEQCVNPSTSERKILF